MPRRCPAGDRRAKAADRRRHKLVLHLRRAPRPIKFVKHSCGVIRVCRCLVTRSVVALTLPDTARRSAVCQFKDKSRRPDPGRVPYAGKCLLMRRCEPTSSPRPWPTKAQRFLGCAGRRRLPSPPTCRGSQRVTRAFAPGMRGSVLSTLTSCPSDTPSPSVSGFFGSVP